jgi:hypothetical protein
MQMKNRNTYEWDGYIYHVSEDKDYPARSLSKLLQTQGLRVSIDNQELTIGDSLRRKIDDGLANSRFGIVILSKNFFKKEWPQKELDALVSREDGKDKFIFLIWDRVTHSDIRKFSPLLADKAAYRLDDGIKIVVREILKVLKVVAPDLPIVVSTNLLPPELSANQFGISYTDMLMHDELLYEGPFEDMDRAIQEADFILRSYYVEDVWLYNAKGETIFEASKGRGENGKMIITVYVDKRSKKGE